MGGGGVEVVRNWPWNSLCLVWKSRTTSLVLRVESRERMSNILYADFSFRSISRISPILTRRIFTHTPEYFRTSQFSIYDKINISPQKNWTLVILCQIVKGPRFQNDTFKCCFLTWRRTSEKVDSYGLTLTSAKLVFFSSRACAMHGSLLCFL